MGKGKGKGKGMGRGGKGGGKGKGKGKKKGKKKIDTQELHYALKLKQAEAKSVERDQLEGKKSAKRLRDEGRKYGRTKRAKISVRAQQADDDVELFDENQNFDEQVVKKCSKYDSLLGSLAGLVDSDDSDAEVGHVASQENEDEKVQEKFHN